MDNVFKLARPDERTCRTIHLTDGHRTLTIETSLPKREDIIKLHFRKVKYFSGWLNWMGANFVVADAKKKQEFIKRVDENLHKQYLADYFLFICIGKNHKVYILANAARSQLESGKTLLEVPDS